MICYHIAKVMLSRLLRQRKHQNWITHFTIPTCQEDILIDAIGNYYYDVTNFFLIKIEFSSTEDIFVYYNKSGQKRPKSKKDLRGDWTRTEPTIALVNSHLFQTTLYIFKYSPKA